jgi:lipopolysaccharide export LptBFGC system permease protein LptF
MARPFLLVAVVFSAVHAWLHVKLTPQAARERESQMVRLRAMREKDGRKAEALQEKSALLHHNPADRRMWFIGRADLRGRVLSDVEILQTAPNGRDRTKTYAKTMRPVDGGWELVDGLVLNYDEAGDAVSRETFERRVDAGLGERFDRVTGGAPKAESLGMAELRKAIADPPRSGAAHVAPFRTYLAFRWTAGLTCVATVLACVALGIGNSRRNLFVGMSRALGLFVGFFALGKLCLALGQGARIPAWLGGAGPSVAFLLIGLGLLWLRGSRIELRGPWQWWCDRAAERGV